jgi:hypothetical protein
VAHFPNQQTLAKTAGLLIFLWLLLTFLVACGDTAQLDTPSTITSNTATSNATTSSMDNPTTTPLS